MSTALPASDIGSSLRSVRDAKIIVFDGSLAASYLTCLFVDLGAEVTRVRGPWSLRDDAIDSNWLPEHQIIDVDLNSAATVNGLSDVIATADVIVDATEKGDMSRWGFFPGESASRRSGVIYTCMPSFGREAQPGGGDAVLSAALGLWAFDEARPTVEPLPIASAYGAIISAFWTAIAISTLPDKRGSYLEIPVFNAGLVVLGRRVVSPQDARLIDPLTVPKLPLAQICECSDGRYVQLHGTARRFAEAVMQVGQPEWADAALDAAEGLPDQEAVSEWRSRLADMIKRFGSAHWEDQIASHGGSCTICRKRSEWLDTAHAHDSGMIVETRNSAGEVVRRVGPPVKVRPGPKHDGVRRLPRSPSELRVLDLCIILAGPTCGRFLSEAGADVIKVDPPRSPFSAYGWLEVNRGKRSILVDLKRKEGKDVLWRLLEDADVLLENFRSGKLESLGFGYNQVSERFPHIIYASLNAMDYGGEWERRPGWEQNAQAATGMQVGRQSGGRPMAATVPVNDYGTGMLGALGVVAALQERDRTGKGQHVSGSLSRTASFIQGPWLFGAGSDTGAIRTRAEQVQSCRDGWVVAEGPSPTSAEPGTSGTSVSPDDTCAEALSKLWAAGYSAAEIVRPETIRTSAALREAGLVVDWQHDFWGIVTQVTGKPAASPGFVGPKWPAPDPGQNTEEILAEAGFGASEVQQLLSSGVISGRIPLF